MKIIKVTKADATSPEDEFLDEIDKLNPSGFGERGDVTFGYSKHRGLWMKINDSSGLSGNDFKTIKEDYKERLRKLEKAEKAFEKLVKMKEDLGLPGEVKRKF